MPPVIVSSAEPKPLILIVEDEVQLADLIAEYLKSAGMRTHICNRGAHAAKFLKEKFANLLLLDINLPDKSGFEVMEEIRAMGTGIPVIFLTGNAGETSKLRALEMGAEDYITKPFSYAELAARIRTVLRRAEVKADQDVTTNVKLSDAPFKLCGATLKPERLEISFPKSAALKIGRKEMGLLAYFNAHRGRVITRQALIHAVWGVHANVQSRSLDQYILKLRVLFGAHGLTLWPLGSVHGIGYIFDPNGVSKEGRASGGRPKAKKRKLSGRARMRATAVRGTLADRGRFS
jgi:DNA-binding response OmpR family regulator